MEQRNIYQLPPSTCSRCGARRERATNTPGEAQRAPRAGDPSVCGCGHMMIYREDFTLRDVTAEEARLFMADQNFVRRLAGAVTHAKAIRAARHVFN